MGRVQQCAECAGCRRRQTADQLREPDCVGTAPRDKLPFDEPVQLLEGVVVFFPVSVDRENLFVVCVNRDDVRCIIVTDDTIRNLAPAIDLIQVTQTVFVVRVLFLAFDLVVGFGRFGAFRSGAGCNFEELQVTIQSRSDPFFLLELIDVLNVGDALRRLERRSRIREQNVVNRHKFAHWTIETVVVPEFLELRATKRQLSQQLFQL